MSRKWYPKSKRNNSNKMLKFRYPWSSWVHFCHLYLQGCTYFYKWLIEALLTRDRPGYCRVETWHMICKSKEIVFFDGRLGWSHTRYCSMQNPTMSETRIHLQKRSPTLFGLLNLDTIARSCQEVIFWCLWMVLCGQVWCQGSSVAWIW